MKKMKRYAEGGLSQEDIDKMSYSEAFKHFRNQGAGTKFTWRGSKQAAYKKGEEPWKSKSRTMTKDEFDAQMEGRPSRLKLPKIGLVDLEDEATRPKPGSGYKTPGRRYTGVYGETAEAMDESGVTPEQKSTALKIGAGTLASAVGGPELAALRGARSAERVAAGSRGMSMAEREAARRAEDAAAEKVARGLSRRGMPDFSTRYRAGEEARAAREAFRKSRQLDEQLSSDMAGGYRKGGKVKKMAGGGSVSSASKRADGIAQRGKTKGRFV